MSNEEGRRGERRVAGVFAQRSGMLTITRLLRFTATRTSFPSPNCGPPASAASTSTSCASTRPACATSPACPTSTATAPPPRCSGPSRPSSPTAPPWPSSTACGTPRGTSPSRSRRGGTGSRRAEAGRGPGGRRGWGRGRRRLGGWEGGGWEGRLEGTGWVRSLMLLYLLSSCPLC